MRRIPALDEVTRLVQELRPLQPGAGTLWVVLPSARLVHALEHRLLDAKLACAGVRLQTATKALACALADRGVVPAPRANGAALLAWLSHAIQTTERQDRQSTELDYLGRFPSARRAWLTRLQAHRAREAANRSADGPVTRDGDLLDEFATKLGRALAHAGLSDAATVLDLARQHLATPHASDPTHVIVYAPGPRDQPELTALLRTIGRRAEVHAITPGAWQTPGRSLPEQPDTKLATFTAQGVEAELSEAFGRAREHIAAGCPAHRIAIVAPRTDAYDPWLTHVATREEVPLATRPKTALLGHPLASLALRLVTLVTADLPRRHLCGVLADPGFDLAGFAAGNTSSASVAGIGELDRITREAGCIGGTSTMLTVLRAALASERGVSHDLAAIAPAVERFAARVQEVRAVLQHAETARAQIDALTEWLRTWLIDDDANPRVRALILARTLGLCQMTSLDVRAQELEAWPGHLEESFARAVSSSELGDPDGVQFLPLDDVRGLAFDHVFLLGFNRGELPRPRVREPESRKREVEAARARQSAARAELPDKIRQALLPLPAHASEDEDIAFENLGAILESTSRSVTVSFLRANAQGQPQAPSAWLSRVQRAFSGATPDPGAGLACTRVPWPPAERVQHRVEVGRSLSEAEVLLHTAFGGNTQELASLTERYVPEQAAAFAAGAQWIETRDSFELRGGDALRFDALQIANSPNDDDAGFSVTQLDRLGSCPLQYYLRDVLRTRPLATEPVVDDVSRRLLGSAIHELLQHVFARWIEASTPEQTPDDAVALTALRNELEAATDALLSTLADRLPLLRAHVLQTWQESLERIVTLDLAEQRCSGFRPSLLEEAIQRRVELDAETAIELHGRLDRIDVDADGSRRILDYKTGGSFAPNKGKIGKEAFRGTRLQLALYSILLDRDEQGRRAPAELRGVAPEQLAACHGELPRTQLDPKVLENIHGVIETVCVLVRLARSASFPFRKGMPCRWCDFRAACPRHHPPSIERQQRLAELEDFRSLDKKTLGHPLLHERSSHPSAEVHP